MDRWACFEEPPFNEGTIGIANAVAEAADRGAIVIVGGGDSVAAVTQAGVADRITHISTGGGATLEFLAGEELPGVAALSDKDRVVFWLAFGLRSLTESDRFRRTLERQQS